MKEFLSQQGKTFDVRNVDEDQAAYDALLELGYRSVPVTVIGSIAVRGFDPDALLKALEDVG